MPRRSQPGAKPIAQQVTGAASTVIASNLPANTVAVVDASGKLASASAITANRALTSNATGLPAAATTTAAELGALSASATADTTSTIADADTSLGKVGGVIKQITFDRIFNYVKDKLTGASSSVLTADLTANRVLVSGSDGKIAARNIGTNRLLVSDANGLPTAHNVLLANRIMMTDANGLPTAAIAGPIYYKNSITTSGTYDVVTMFNGGFTVQFVHTGSAVYLRVTHTNLGSRYQYQTTTNSGAPASFWTSSSGNNYPANLPAIANNGGALSGWFFGVDGSGQTTSCRVDFSIITNGASICNLYACVS